MIGPVTLFSLSPLPFRHLLFINPTLLSLFPPFSFKFESGHFIWLHIKMCFLYSLIQSSKGALIVFLIFCVPEKKENKCLIFAGQNWKQKYKCIYTFRKSQNVRKNYIRKKVWYFNKIQQMKMDIWTVCCALIQYIKMTGLLDLFFWIHFTIK